MSVLVFEGGESLERLDLIYSMRDGIHLAATATVPSGGGSYPVILTRTYTDRRLYDEIALQWSSLGFAFVAQDVRGKYASEGEFHPYIQEGLDGVDTVERLASEPWCNGSIILEGGSYGAFCILAAAACDEVNRITALNVLVPATGLRRTAFPRGVFQLYDRLWWDTVFASGKTDKQQAFSEIYQEDHSQLLGLPVSGLAKAFPLPSPHWDAIITDQYPEEKLDWHKLDKPAMHIGGWNDVFIEDTLAVYANLLANGKPQVLIVGPWAHDVNRHTQVHAREYGPSSRIPLGSMQVAWYRYTLGVRDAFPYPAVLLFVMTANCWVAPPAWPVPGAAPYRLYLHKDGSLRHMPPRREERAVKRYVYNPLAPFPTRDVPLPRNDLEIRSDCLVFTTETLAEPLLVAGFPNASLAVSSSAPATDFFVTLTEVMGDGASIYVTHGFIRLDRFADPALGENGGIPSPMRIPLRPICQLFPAGCRLRLTVASSSFPRYARHLNTRENPLLGTDAIQAIQAIWLSSDSFLELPLHPTLIKEWNYEFKRRANST